MGVFRDLSLQRVDCLIVDKGDFGAGASSAPSRMIHGGLRYLENGSFSLVAEATRERNLLLRNAPHLVRPLKTVVPLASFFGGLPAARFKFFGRPPPQRSARPAGGGAGPAPVRPAGPAPAPVIPGHRINRVPPRDRRLFAARRSAGPRPSSMPGSAIPEWLILELIGDRLPRPAALGAAATTAA